MITAGLTEQLVAEAAERAASLVVEKLKRLLDERQEQWLPLHEILGIKRHAASARIARDKRLRDLSVAEGRGGMLLFRRSTVEGYLASKVRGEV